MIIEHAFHLVQPLLLCETRVTFAAHDLDTHAQPSYGTYPPCSRWEPSLPHDDGIVTDIQRPMGRPSPCLDHNTRTSMPTPSRRSRLHIRCASTARESNLRQRRHAWHRSAVASVQQTVLPQGFFRGAFDVVLDADDQFRAGGIGHNGETSPRCPRPCLKALRCLRRAPERSYADLRSKNWPSGRADEREISFVALFAAPIDL